MENRPTCRKCSGSEGDAGDGIRGFLLECVKCRTWVHPGCHKPNVSEAAFRAMMAVSDRTQRLGVSAQAVPGSLEAWSCRDCQPPSQPVPNTPSHSILSVSRKSTPAVKTETIDLTLDSDDDDDVIQVVQPPTRLEPQRAKQEVKGKEGVSHGGEQRRWEIKVKVPTEIPTAAAAVPSTIAPANVSGSPAFQQYIPPSYLSTLSKNREVMTKAYLESLFPSNHTRTRAEYHVLFATRGTPVDNPFREWLTPQATMPLPKPATTLPQRRRIKPVAKYMRSCTTSQLQETGWSDL